MQLQQAKQDSVSLSASRDARPRTAERDAEAHALPAALAYLDLLALACGAAVALALGAPAAGVIAGAGAWVLQRVLARLDRGLVMRAREPRNLLALNIAEAFGRIWLLAGAIIAAGVAGSRADGLACAITIGGAYSIAFAVRIFGGPPRSGAQARNGAHA